MITKGIVEEFIDKYKVRVRIPVLDRVKSSNVHTKTEDLSVVTICTFHGCTPRFEVGDIVFVLLDSTLVESGVIIGCLYRSEMLETYCDLILNDLTTVGSTKLTENTTIGKVSKEEIQCLSGVKNNIQQTLEYLQYQINELKS